MSTEALIHPVLSSTTVAEQTSDVIQQIKEFYDRNHTTLSVAAVLAASLFLTRVIVRHELTRLHFIVDVISDSDFTDLESFDEMA